MRINPSHRVAQAAQAEAQLPTRGMAIDHNLRRAPSLAGAVKAGRGNLHIGRALAVARKPEGSERRRIARRHSHQHAGVRRRHACRHGDGAARHRRPVPGGGLFSGQTRCRRRQGARAGAWALRGLQRPDGQQHEQGKACTQKETSVKQHGRILSGRPRAASWRAAVGRIRAGLKNPSPYKYPAGPATCGANVSQRACASRTHQRLSH